MAPRPGTTPTASTPRSASGPATTLASRSPGRWSRTPASGGSRASTAPRRRAWRPGARGRGRLVAGGRRPVERHLGHLLRHPLPEEGDPEARRERGPEAVTRAGVVLVLLGGLAAAQEADPQRVEFFEKKVRPIFSERCFSCHSAQ